MKLKQCHKIFHMFLNAIHLNVIQIKNGIIKHVNVNIKVIVREKNYRVAHKNVSVFFWR